MSTKEFLGIFSVVFSIQYTPHGAQEEVILKIQALSQPFNAQDAVNIQISNFLFRQNFNESMNKL